MNNFNEFPPEAKDYSREFQDLSTLEKLECTAESIYQDISNYWDSIQDVFGLGDSTEQVSDVTKVNDSAREYGINECADAAKEIFTPDVIANWGIMDLKTRNEVAQQYAEAVGKGLNINYKGIVWEKFPSSDGTYTSGYNAGDGYIHLNTDLVCDPSKIMQLVDTVAHEARHQFQTEAITNPEKYEIDEATINEWTVGESLYTTELPSAYDPWGYTYNSLEIDARYFGESMVRELTKDIINNA